MLGIPSLRGNSLISDDILEMRLTRGFENRTILVMSRLKNGLSKTIALGVSIHALIALLFVPFTDSSSCCCSAPASNIAVASSCCEAEVEQNSCCSSIEKKSCCCAPVSTECSCLGCECGDSEDHYPVRPYAPSQQQIDLVFVGQLGLDANLMAPWPEAQTAWPTEYAFHSSVSALEKCVLLSRFTC